MALGELKNGIGPDAYAIYQQVLAAVVERDHPVGSLYISENSTSPAELYGGTWERIEGKFIMGASDTYPAGSTGGSATHTHLMPIGWDRGNIFYAMNAGLGPFYGDQIVNGTKSLLIKTTSSPSGDSDLARLAITKSSDTLPPYYSMYIWRRVA